MVFILRPRGKHHLAIGGYLQLHIAVAVVGEGEAAEFSAAVFQHGDLSLGLDAVVEALVGELVAGETHAVALRHDI